ncbi:MAG: ABC transporter ATP-binding protein, partial [Firmicutes bacterium]|nr:ABC transporter ATP-binding protein [Bacillota bacterium]MDY5856933.1 ABC transporter ATP-binding protein [Anaerovoracaceae bacterium]
SSLNPTVSVGGQIAETIRLHEKISRKEAMERAEELLGQVGIPEPHLRSRQYPHHFSGGMRQRVAIAIALASNPALLIADEPTTSLDIATQNQIMQLLQSLVRQNPDRAMLFVTHDLGLAETLADRIVVMKDGRIVEEGSTDRIFSDPRHDYTKKLLGYAAYGKGTSHYHGHLGDPADGAFWRTDQCDGRPLVTVSHLTKAFPLGKQQVRTVLEDFSLNIYKGEIVGLVGDSGCGKSTLARCLMGIYRPEAGKIKLEEGCRKQMIFQDSASAFNPRMTLEQIIAEPLTIEALRQKKKTGERILKRKESVREKVLEMMDQVGLPRELEGRHPYDVSGGQRQRAAIARALITDPDFLIADEPIASLDVSMQSQIVHLLKQLHDQRQLTLLLISHDLPMVEHISDRVVKLF